MRAWPSRVNVGGTARGVGGPRGGRRGGRSVARRAARASTPEHPAPHLPEPDGAAGSGRARDAGGARGLREVARDGRRLRRQRHARDAEDRQSGEPRHLADRQERADRRRPDTGEGRHPPALQLRRLHRAQGREGLREEVRGVRRQGPGVDVQRHRRGADEDPGRQLRLRHLLPELRPDRQDGQREADPSAQPELRPQHRQRLARVHRPLVRRRVAVLRPVQRLHDRHRLAGRPHHRRPRRGAQPVRRLLGPGVLEQARGHRRLAHRDGDGRRCGPASPTSTRRSRRTSRSSATSCSTCSRRRSRRSPSRCTTTCRPASSTWPRCGRATSSTRSTTCPRASGRRCWRTGTRRTAPGMVDNDLMVVLAQGKNPVLAHLFLDFMLDTKNALDNFGYVGYQPPQTSLDAAVDDHRRLRAREPRAPRSSSRSGSPRATGCSSCRRPPTRRGTRSGSSSRPAPDP